MLGILRRVYDSGQNASLENVPDRWLDFPVVRKLSKTKAVWTRDFRAFRASERRELGFERYTLQERVTRAHRESPTLSFKSPVFIESGSRRVGRATEEVTCFGLIHRVSIDRRVCYLRGRQHRGVASSEMVLSTTQTALDAAVLV